VILNVILVSDTSVLIDLERGEFLDPCFKLPFVFAVPDLLYNRELADFGGRSKPLRRSAAKGAHRPFEFFTPSK
jgi:hypothetical protein